MEDKDKTKAQLVKELETLREEIDKLKEVETKHEQADKVVQETEAQLRTVIESIPFDIFMIDATGHYVLQNSTCRKNWGDIIGKRPEDVIQDQETLTLWDSNNGRAFAGEVVSGEVRFKINNEERYFYNIIAPIKDYDKIYGILGINIDITERKQAEESLKRREQEIRLIAENVPALFSYIDADGCYRFVNKQYETWFGVSQTEIMGKHYREVLGEPAYELIKDSVEAALSGKKVYYEKSLPYMHGGKRWVSANYVPYIDVLGKANGFFALVTDITDRKQIEESLKQLIHQHKLILDAAGEGLAGLNLEGKITFANPFVIKTTGYKIEELIGQDLHEILHYKKPDGTPYPPEECPINETLKKGITKTIRDEVFFRKDGTSFPVRYTSTPIIEDGVIKGAVVTFRDITERKRLEEQFLQAQKMEAVGQLAGGVAHDFNNILTAIIGYGNLLQMKLKKDDPFQVYVNQILISSEKAANLTHSLLAFSRKQIINLKAVNLNDIVKSVEKLLMRVIGEDIELQTKFTDKDLIITADSGQIEQVLMNLATNARDAMPDGGLLIISTEVVELDKGYIKTHSNSKPGKYALISVTDTGKGIDKKTKELIFEPFFTTKERGRGTGLGLAVVYGIVKQHNGNIDVRSELDKGTTFKIYLPIIEAEVKETELKVITTPTGGKETILIAEDNIDVRNFIKTVLEQFSYKVIEAVNGEDAINKFMENKNRIEFLILDVIMPKKNGKEAYEAIKKVRPDIKALFLSGYTENIIHRKGMLEEGLNFVLKPISPQKLLKKIREVLDT